MNGRNFGESRRSDFDILLVVLREAHEVLPNSGISFFVET
jgi:hypothetical protein